MVNRNIDGTSAIDDQVDEMSDESFPASDPPSFTPVAHIGEPPGDEIDDYPDVDMEDRPWMSLAMKVGMLVLAIGTLAMVIMGARKRRERKRSRRRPDIAHMGESAGAVITPLMDAAKGRLQAGQDVVRERAQEAAARLAA